MKTNAQPIHPTRSYDPGTIRDFQEIAPGVFQVRSFKSDTWYRVDLTAGTCGCAAYTHGGGKPCKHLRSMAVIANAARWSLPYLDRRIAEFTAAGDAERRALAEAARRVKAARVQQLIRTEMEKIHGLASPWI